MFRLSTHRAGKRHRRFLGKLIKSRLMEACEITMLWQSAAVDAADETGAETPKELTDSVGALVHYVSLEAVTRQAAEWEAGDAIVTLSGKVSLEDKFALRFVLPDGGTYVQRRTSGNLEQFWDAIFDSKPVGKTFLLRRSQ